MHTGTLSIAQSITITRIIKKKECKKKAAMKAISFLQTCLLFFCISITIFSLPSAAVMKGGYYLSWRASQLPPSAIDTTYFTHIYYSFLVPDSNSNFNIDAATGQLLSDFTTSLHRKNPPVKALFSIGGGGLDPALFAGITSTVSTRKTFITNTIQIARKYGFDGMDLDWESPRDTNEMGHFGSLMAEWRSAIVSDSQVSNKPQLLLSAAVYFHSSFFFDTDTRPYPIASINQNMDWINAMCYDYHGTWDTSATGAPAALYDPNNARVSTSSGLQSWINSGIQKNKLNMGMPLYGATWTLKNPSVSGVGAPAIGVGPGGDGGAGTLYYYEIQQYIAAHNARVVLDMPTGSAYAVDGSNWIGYDSTDSIALKVRYARSLGIGGYFFWALSYDLNNQISKAASDAWTS